VAAGSPGASGVPGVRTRSDIGASSPGAGAPPLRPDERLRLLLLAFADAIVMADDGQRIVMFNPRAIELFGYGEQEALGQRLDILIPERTVQAHRQHVRGFVDEPTVPRRLTLPREVSGRRKDGTEFPAELTLAKIQQDGRWYFAATIRDLSARKATERELQRYALALERSNADLEDFASVASHDLQEPLRKILAFGGRLRQRAAGVLDGDALDDLARMQSAAERMAHLTSSLLALARVKMEGHAFETTDLAAAAADALADLEARVQESGAVVEVGALPTLRADPVQMRLLFLNLIGNAIKFRTPGRSPKVRLLAERASDGRWRITVEDDGIGFDERYAERVFKPFQRLQGRGDFEGNGIGLTICSRIVDRHQGEIVAHSTPGEGSQFVVTLPEKQPFEER
jgi:two-component system sensor kinase FixL